MKQRQNYIFRGITIVALLILSLSAWADQSQTIWLDISGQGSISVSIAGGAPVSASEVAAGSGQTVTLTATPQSGYYLSDIAVEAVIDASHAARGFRRTSPALIPLTQSAVNPAIYTFTMPSDDYLGVRVTAVFKGQLVVNIHSVAATGLSMAAIADDSKNPCRVIATNDADAYQQWILEEAGSGFYYLKNKGRVDNGSANVYLAQKDVDKNGTGGDIWSFVFVPASELDSYGDRARFFIEYNSSKNAHLIRLVSNLLRKDAKYYVSPNDNLKNSGAVVGDKTLSSTKNQWDIVTLPKTQVSTPTITFGDTNITIACATEGATIYYTTDGSEPRITEACRYTGPIPVEGVAMVRAFAVKENSLNSLPVELYSPNSPFLIQSQNNSYFYLIPGQTDNGNIVVNTHSLAQPSMAWYLIDAGVDGGLQWYYIKNRETGAYLFANSSSNVFMKPESDFNSSSNDYKFRIWRDGYAGCRIVPKSKDDNSLYKANHSKVDKVGLNGSINATTCRWNLIPIPDGKMPAMAMPFSFSTDEHAEYFKIRNGNTSDAYYIIPPTGTTGNALYASTSTDGGDNASWFFKKAGADDWNDYFWIVNAVTGEYLYYNGNITKDSQSNAFVTKPISASTSETADRFLFLLSPVTTTVSSNHYFIIPKAIKDTDRGMYYNVIWRDNTNPLKTNQTRDDLQRKWIFESSPFSCEAPVITVNQSTNQVSMACTAPDMKIYYIGSNSLRGADPTVETGTLYTGPFTAGYAFYKAIAVRNSDGSDKSIVAISEEIGGFRCATPVIEYNFDTYEVKITSATAGTTIWYTIDVPLVTENYATYTRYTGQFTLDGNPHVIRAVAIVGSDIDAISDIAVFNGIPISISRSSEITDMDASYMAGDNFVVDTSDPIGTSDAPFKGKFDGNFIPLSLSHPLFGVVDGGVVRNVTVSTASITTSDNAGAIACVAKGDARIYNCGVLAGTVSGSVYAGGLVGLLDGNARVINCYSFADVAGGSDVGGIVGYNNVASKSSDIRTMVMNCMFYGNITGGTKVSPIYGGKIIRSNYSSADDAGINNYNYYRFASTITGGSIVYNCALAAEERFLTRFEFYRQILNSNRELAAWYATGSADNARTVMAKWVLETADRSITSPKPYPVLKPQGKYPSIINYDAANAPTSAERNKGGKMGTLTVNISMGSGGAQFRAPSGASIGTSSLTLNITDKDYDHYNFNYRKVQLPYYNDVGTKNYTGGRVVTGWKIVSVSGGTPGTFKAEDSAEGYNFADRDCTDKDLYSVTGRVFAQGAYYDVPNGVTAINIEPYWAKAVYCSDPNYDKTYNSTYGNPTDFAAAGVRYTNNTDYPEAGSGQKVYTTLNNAITGLNPQSAHTVFDYAVVLVGNVHAYYDNSAIRNDNNPFTLMSIDLDSDNEPDYSFIYQHQQRQYISPVRFDFLNWPGVGMAQKAYGSTRMPQIGIFKPRGWFEVTNTCLAQFYQFEYDCSRKTADKAPLILQGGIIEQITSTNEDGGTGHTSYIHLGSNVWFKMFNNGVHADKTLATPHTPISVNGGDYEKFYLSGMFRPDASVSADNAECYISGGRFDELAGAGQEQIKGNVAWKISDADIAHFYGGGINAAKPVTGNIDVTIKNSHVDTYCGGPKFGDMASEKTVNTNASGCTFGTFFGAGYGGTSYYRLQTKNLTNAPNYGFNGWVTSDYKRKYDASNNGIATNFEYELFPFSGFANDNNVGRFYVNYASLSLAVTHDVTSSLTDCTITGNFYGGGSLGKVDGNATSTLTGCTVEGSAFGAGFSASVPTVDVMPVQGYNPEPYYNGEIGVYTIGVPPASVTYTWHQVASVSAGKEFDDENKYIYTTVDLSALGTVTGKATLNIAGNTLVKGQVFDAEGNVIGLTGGAFGGGDSSAALGDTEVNIAGSGLQSGATYNVPNVFGGGNIAKVGGVATVNLTGGIVGQHVFGGGNQADVNTSTSVVMTGGQVLGNVYGGGNLGDVGTIDKSNISGYKWTTGTGDSAPWNNTGLSAVAISGGTVGSDGVTSDDHGNVFGAGKGVANTFWCEKGMVYKTSVSVTAGTVHGTVFGGGEVGRVEADTEVTIGAATGDATPDVKGDVFGAGKGLDTHGYSALVRGNTHVTLQGKAKVGHSVYGGGEIATVGKYALVTNENQAEHPDLEVGMPYSIVSENLGVCTVTVKGNAQIGNGQAGTGNVFGAGQGLEPSYVASGDGRSKRMMTYDATVFKDGDKDNTWAFSDASESYVWEYFDAEHYLKYVETLALVTRTNVTIGGSAAVKGSVYGGSESGFVQHHTAVKIDETCQIGSSVTGGNVYGGGKGLASYAAGGRVSGDGSVAVSGGTVFGSVFGGGEMGITKGNVAVSVTGGEVKEDVYGGGALADTNTGHTAEHQLSTTVSLTGGQVRDVYGGGLGQIAREASQGVAALEAVEAIVYGNVTVKLNEGVAADAKGCVVERIFGCNNQNGTPKGSVKVYVHATQNAAKENIAAKNALHDGAETDAESTYDVKAVYGGGNLSPYVPTSGDARTEVYINGCSLTSIKQVYGGGNAAPAPATLVEVTGSYEIEEVFGGGNGKDDYQIYGKTYLNPGANVGYRNYTHPVWNETLGKYEAVDNTSPDASTKEARLANYQYGTGVATTHIYGGKIHYVYGGSNEKGNISNTARSVYEEQDVECPIQTDETYGGGKNSIIDGTIDLGLGCVQNMTETFGGSKNADVNSDIVLTIINGHYGKVFGGNNTSGNVNGSITVKIIESGCAPVIIDELYAGGYLADYSVYGYKADGKVRTKAEWEEMTTAEKAAEGLTEPRHDPRINIVSATEIKNVYGGGYRATVVGNPHINVNMEKGLVIKEYAKNAPAGAEEDSQGNKILPIGTVGNIYGGGNEADIIGSTYVEIGTGKHINDSGVEETIDRHTATITGNVFGGGNNADVTENTYVTIEGKNTGTEGAPKGSVTIAGSVYGGGNLGSVGTFNVIGTAKPASVTAGTGLCTVTVGGYAEIGPDGMQMTADAGPDDAGHVFGASRGEVNDTTQAEYSNLRFKTYVDRTEVTIGGHAFVKGSVYGGSENGHVLHDTHVTIADDCQIGNGDGIDRRYTAAEWDGTASLKECASWTYEADGKAYDRYDGTEGYDSDNGAVVATNGQTFYGNVFGGGSGYYPYAPGKWLRSAGIVEGNTVVDITGGHILSNVYGGCEVTDVFGSSTINMTGGTVGVLRTREEILAHPVTCSVFGAGKGDKRVHFNTWTNVGTTSVNIRGGRVYASVFGGGEDGHVLGNATTTVSQAEGKTLTIGSVGTSGADGIVFGGGRGSATALTAGVVGGNITLNVESGTVLGAVYGGGRLASVGTNFTNPELANGDPNPLYGKMQEGDAHGNITIGITGGNIGTVYGGCKGVEGNDQLGISKDVKVNISETDREHRPAIAHDVYGGGEAGNVQGNVEVNIQGGTVGGDVYGGGALADTNTGHTAETPKTTAVNLHGGTIGGDVYGGGLGRLAGEGVTEVKALVQAPVTVELNKNTAADTCVVKGSIFGCNNLNGTPLDNVTVHIYKTHGYAGHTRTAAGLLDDPSDEKHAYELKAVYGGGNLSAYQPTDLANGSTHVIIDGCDMTSIRQVYGGGNAASTPATKVEINGTYEIEEVFGGGNGKDRISLDGGATYIDNPGANVGFYDYSAVESTYDTREKRQAAEFTSAYTYGTGSVDVKIVGGRIHRVFGGSNTKGNVRVVAVTMLEDEEVCDFHVDEAYGGGKSAPMDGAADLRMACIPGLKAAYGGAEEADIHSDVTLNITNGTFDRVFGGNNVRGTIDGTITVNIEETGCKPVIIGQLYGGGNQAPYNANGKEGPTVNVKSFTAIGEIYGGGYGATATVTGDTHVNVNVVKGLYADNDKSVYAGGAKTISFSEYRRTADGGFVLDDDGNRVEETKTVTVAMPAHAKGDIGTIGYVFGGGNAAQVDGNTYVNIGTEPTIDFATAAEGSSEPADGVKVVGANITGNVYGGGNQATVTGSTNVRIGRD